MAGVEVSAEREALLKEIAEIQSEVFGEADKEDVKDSTTETEKQPLKEDAFKEEPGLTSEIIRGVADGAEEGFKSTLNIFADVVDLAGFDGEKIRLDFNFIDAPTTQTGKVVSNISQFMTGFAGGGVALMSVKAATKLHKLYKVMGTGAIADFFAFDGQTENLSNVIQDIPALKNPVNEFLAKDKEDANLLSRVKNTLEGAGLGVAAGGFIKGLKLMRNISPYTKATREIAETITDKTAKQTFLQKVGQTSLSKRKSLAKSRDVLIEYRSQALLSSPATQGRNIISNTGIVGNAILERWIARGASKAFQKGKGVVKGETLALMNGYWSSLSRGLKQAWSTTKTGKSAFGMTKVDWEDAIAIEKVKGTEKNILGKGIDMFGSLVRVPGKLLGGGDEFFKTINYDAQLTALATRTAINKGLTGKALKKEVTKLFKNPPDSIKNDATNFAKVNTFTNDLGKLAGPIEEIRNSFPTVKLIVPFYRTLANITKYGLERFPVTAPMFKQFSEDLAAGGARAAQATAKLGAGSLYTGLGLMAYVNGALTASGPSFKQSRDRNKLKQLQATGWKPHSVKVGNTWYDYSRLDPLGKIIGLAADSFEALDHLTEDDVEGQESIIGSLTLTLGNSFTEGSWASNLADFFDIVTSNDERKMDKFMQKFAGSLVPNILRQFTTTVDDNMRVATDTLEEIKKRIPGLSDELTERRDVFGRTQTYNNKGVGSLINPMITSEETGTDWEKYLLDNDLVMSYPTSAAWFDGVQIKLSDQPEIFSRYLELSGKIKLPDYDNLRMTDYIEALVLDKHVDSEDFLAMETGQGSGQEKFLKKVVSDYRKAAREELLIERPDLAAEVAEKRVEKTELKVGLKELKRTIKNRKKGKG